MFVCRYQMQEGTKHPRPVLLPDFHDGSKRTHHLQRKDNLWMFPLRPVKNCYFTLCLGQLLMGLTPKWCSVVSPKRNPTISIIRFRFTDETQIMSSSLLLSLNSVGEVQSKFYSNQCLPPETKRHLQDSFTYLTSQSYNRKQQLNMPLTKHQQSTSSYVERPISLPVDGNCSFHCDCVCHPQGTPPKIMLQSGSVKNKKSLPNKKTSLTIGSCYAPIIRGR